MNVAHLIAQKRDGETLDQADIESLINGFTSRRRSRVSNVSFRDGGFL